MDGIVIFSYSERTKSTGPNTPRNKIALENKQHIQRVPCPNFYISSSGLSQFRQGDFVAMADQKFAAGASTVGVTFPLEVTLKYLRLELVAQEKFEVVWRIYSL